MSETRDTTSQTTHESVGHERRDVVFRPIIAASIGLSLVVLLVFVGMWRLFEYYAAREAARSTPANPLAAEYGRQEPPEPRLQVAPIQDIRQLRAAEDALLESYGWVDREAGIVRIPIDRAMKLLAERGLDTGKPGNES